MRNNLPEGEHCHEHFKSSVVVFSHEQGHFPYEVLRDILYHTLGKEKNAIVN